IDVSVREPEKAVQRRHGRFLGRPCVRRIYIFTAEKSGDRKGTIQFISVRADNEGRSLVETVASAYRTFASIPGISAIVPLSKVLENPRQLLNPAAHTAVFEEPKAPDTASLIRDLRRLEERRIALTKDIADLAQSLSKRV
ncbi:MAG TPA: hypothetical protein O0X50_03770, partial [Methanocorpusculum sp.]|nr:hypothetical protein [Methanocorpusculum sp.]